MTQFRRDVPPELVTLFATHKSLDVADLYTIELSGGLVFRWTDADAPVTVGADTWLLGPGLERDLLEYRAGVDTQSAEFTVTDDGRTLVGGRPLLPFMLRGGFDGARIVIDQAYAPIGTAAWVGKLERFTGNCADVRTGGSLQVKVTVKSITEVFSRPLPTGVYGPQCENNLYDPNCGLDRDDYLVLGATTGPATGVRLQVPHALAQLAGWFDLGTIAYYTGPNAGVRRTIRQHTSGQLILMQPLPAVGGAGDQFEIWPGCNRVRDADCANKFDNRGRFRGEPHVPPPETVL